MSHFKGSDITVAYPNFQPDTSILNLLVEALRRNDDGTLLVEGQTSQTASSQDILQQSTSIAAGLRSTGVTAGDYVIICCDKSILSISVLLATMFSGATAMVIHSQHVDTIHQVIKGTEVKAVFCDEAYSERLLQSVSQLEPQPTLVARTSFEDEVMWSLLMNPADDDPVFKVKDVNKHIPCVYFTSGTTGEPKAIQVTDVALQLCAVYFDHKFRRFLMGAPLYWFSAIVCVMSSTLHNYTAVLTNSATAKDNLGLIQEYEVDGLFTGPGALMRYIAEPTLKQYNLSSLKRVFLGGEYVLASVVKLFKRTVLQDRINLEVIYACTETGFLTVTSQEDILQTGIAGRVPAGNELKIVDDEGNEVPIGCMGEILVKTLALMPGYLNKPELNARVFDKDGFFKTGDAGVFDKDGVLYLRGRVVDLINFRGNKVSPADVEDILMTHEAVLDVAVVGTPHPADTQHLTAFVVKRPGHNVSEQELETFVNEKVEDNMRLRGGVCFLDILARPGGKVLRKMLRNMKQ